MPGSDQTRLSYASRQPDLPGDLFAAKLRQACLARTFKTESNPDADVQGRTLRERDAEGRRETRGSTMVETDRPFPAPRPSGQLAHDVDRAAFAARWDDERRAALVRLIVLRDAHLQSLSRLDRIEARIPAIDARAAGGDIAGASREIDENTRLVRREADKRPDAAPAIKRAAHFR